MSRNPREKKALESLKAKGSDSGSAPARQKEPLTEDEKRYLDKLAQITVRNLLLEAGLLDEGR